MATISRKAAPKTPVVPKTMGGIIDMIYELQEERSELERQAASIKEKEEALLETLKTQFDKDKIAGAMGERAKIVIKHEVVPTVNDWDKAWKFIFKTGDTSLVQKRLSVTACREVWNAKKQIPGVEAVQITKYSITKR